MRAGFTLISQSTSVGEVLAHDSARLAKHFIGIVYDLGEIALIPHLCLFLVDRTQVVAEGVDPAFHQVRSHAALLGFEPGVLRAGQCLVDGSRVIAVSGSVKFGTAIRRCGGRCLAVKLFEQS